MKFSLENKIAIVTGGGSGIGEAISMALAENGAEVYILDVDKENGYKTKKAIETKNGKCHYLFCDISNYENVLDSISKIQSDKIDILINNAGVAHIGNVESTSAADFDRLFRINVSGVFHCVKASIPKMKPSGGVIVNISSIAALVGISDRFAYSMTKGAVHSMTLSIARDYLPFKIRCNTISPARVHTPFVDGFISKNYPGQEEEIFEKLSKSQPIGRMAMPVEIANLVLYLCSDEASFITGSNFPIDGGFVTLNN